MLDKKGIGERIKNLRLGTTLTQEEFAIPLGIKRSALSQIEAGNLSPSLELVSAIVSNYNVSYEYLFEGRSLKTNFGAAIEEGFKLGDDREENPVLDKAGFSQRLAHKPVTLNIVADAESAAIPMMDVDISTGYTAHYKDQNFWDRLPVMRIPMQQFKRGLHVALQVNGDSMSPTLYNHDWVILRYVEKKEDIKEGYIHAIVTSDGIAVKRVFNRIKERGSLSLKSDNEGIATYDEKIANILQVWRVECKALSFNLISVKQDLHTRISSLELKMMDLEKKLL